MTYPLDSLRNHWKAFNDIDLGNILQHIRQQSLFLQILCISTVCCVFRLSWKCPDNDIVRKFIDMYAERLRNQVLFMLKCLQFLYAHF